MLEEPAINSTPPTPDPPVAPIEAPAVVLVPEPVAPASAEASTVAETMVDKTADKPVETAPAPEPVVPAAPVPAPVAPVQPPPTPAPTVEPVSSIRQLLIKAKEKIQFRKQAKLEKIMAKAREQGSIGNDEAQKLLRVSDATASRYLAQLVKTGRLRLSGKSKATRYIPAQ